jgi:hypothetical protein
MVSNLDIGHARSNGLHDTTALMSENGYELQDIRKYVRSQS